jgi:membrane protein implicated in regulation of membrane protease activity
MTGTQTGWPVRKLAILFYPFTAAAVAINLFMLALMGQAIGLPALSPVACLWLSLPLGVPATWLVARWVRRLMDEADGAK